MRDEDGKRVARKIRLARENMELIRELTPGEPPEHPDRTTKLAVYKAFQEVVDACMELASAVTGRPGGSSEDDYANIELLRGEDLITETTEGALKEAVLLSNLIIHEYDSLSDREAFRGIMRLMESLREYLERVGRRVGWST